VKKDGLFLGDNMKTAAVFIAVLLASCASIRAPKPFTVDINAPRCAAGSAEMQFDKLLGGLRKDNVSLFYYPDDDAVCIEYRHDYVYYSQFWSKTGRDSFVSSLAQYKTDFEQRSLTPGKSLKTRRSYERIRGFLVWSTMRILSEPAVANLDYNIGYDFKDKLPYFTVIQRAATHKVGSNKTESPNIMMYFTRAQAEELATLFDQEYLRKLELLPDNRSESLGDFLRGLFRRN
jgi:hypothetical protein